jgi:hypothetical protein
MQVVALGLSSSRLDFLPDHSEIDRPLMPRVFYAYPLSRVEQDSATVYCHDRQLLDDIFPFGAYGEGMKHAEHPTQAALILIVEGDEVYIGQNDAALNDYIPTRFPCKISRGETQRLANIIRSWRHFNYHLHRHPRNAVDDAFPDIRMELQYLKLTSEGYYPEYKPVGENLLAQEPAVVTVSDGDDSEPDDSLLGMTLYNGGSESVYPYLFYFDPNDLTISELLTSCIGASVF